MDINTYRKEVEAEIKSFSKHHQAHRLLVEYLRDKLYSNIHKRWFLQPSTLSAIRKHMGDEALEIAQGYLDEPMAKHNNAAFLTENDRRVLGPKTHAQTRGDVYRVIEPQYNKETFVEFRTLRGAVDEVKSFTRGYYRDPKFLGAQGYAVRYNAGGSDQKVLLQRSDGLTLTDLDWLYLILK